MIGSDRGDYLWLDDDGSPPGGCRVLFSLAFYRLGRYISSFLIDSQECIS
jgi:hypothetical protein